MNIIHRQSVQINSCELITLENGEKLLTFSLDIAKNILELNCEKLSVTPKLRQVIKFLSGLNFVLNTRIGYYTISCPKINKTRKKVAMYIQEEKDNYLTLAIHKNILNGLDFTYLSNTYKISQQKRFKGTLTVRLDSEEELKSLLSDLIDDIQEFLELN